MKVVELNLTEEDLKKMSTEDFIELLKKVGIEVEEEDELAEDVRLLKETSTLPFALYSAMDRVNSFMDHGHALNEALGDDNGEAIERGIKIVNECMRQHAEEIGYRYTLELKRR